MCNPVFIFHCSLGYIYNWSGPVFCEDGEYADLITTKVCYKNNMHLLLQWRVTTISRHSLLIVYTHVILVQVNSFNPMSSNSPIAFNHGLTLDLVVHHLWYLLARARMLSCILVLYNSARSQHMEQYSSCHIGSSLENLPYIVII